MSGVGWHSSALARCRKSLAAAKAAADRLALLRSLVRLQDGRAGLKQEGVLLSTEEVELLSRFGLALTGNQDALRLRSEPELVEGLDAALKLDTSNRQTFEPAPADGILLRLTSHPRYQSEAQKAAVRALLTQPPGSGLMVSMPTGSGKSLLFQLAARFGRSINAGVCAIVITPTIALALDHERTLSSLPGLEASRALTGDTPPGQAETIVNAFRRGEVPILLLSPEKALSRSLIGPLTEATRPFSPLPGLDARLTHLFVDEAHIIESWGRSFRPDFQRLPGLLAELRAANAELKAVLLSATLPPAAREVLRASWRLGGEWLEVDARTPRYEHDVVVASYDVSSAREEALDWVVDRIPRPAIIYTTEVADASDLFRRLTSDRGYARAALFTGNTPSQERRQIVDAWAADEYDLVVATSAFGLGINKGDVRSIIHACLPESPARWYQEIGRASRDGGQGVAVCLFVNGDHSDVSQAYSLATTGWLTRELAEARWAALVNSAANKRWEDGRQLWSVGLDAFREGLPRRESDYNRGWNMTLLTLMQRAGSIQVRAVPATGDQPGSNWDIEILDSLLLSRSTPSAWDRIFETRERERRAAKAALAPFVSLMLNPERACVTRAVFELIEPESFAPPCGRCPACRANGREPPGILPCAGLEKAWTRTADFDNRLPGGLILVDPEDPTFGPGLVKLLATLAQVGIEQFIVPQDIVEVVPRFLAETAEMGLVLSTDALTAQTAIGGLPTALLLPNDKEIAAFAVAKLRKFSGEWPDLPMIVVGEPGRLLDRRRLDQTVSAWAPIHEGWLRRLNQKRS